MNKKAFSLASGRYTVFVLPQNRQPGVGTRVKQRRHSTRHACFFVSSPQCAHFTNSGFFTIASFA